MYKLFENINKQIKNPHETTFIVRRGISLTTASEVHSQHHPGGYHLTALQRYKENED